MRGASPSFGGTQRFVVRRRLGAGAMGEVYEAYDTERDRTVALKTLIRTDAAALYRFKREFRSLAEVTHPNLVSLYELVADADCWFFTMELVDGVNFLQYVRGQPVAPPTAVPNEESPSVRTADPATSTLRATEQHGTVEDPGPESDPAATRSRPVQPISPLLVERLRAALRGLAEGVLALHRVGRLHRDLKPPNVLATTEGRVVILDFGLVTDTLAESAEPGGVIVGTPVYMAPEQGAGKALSEASDWYSVGVMMYEALAGRPPFTGTFSQMAAEKLQIEPPRVSALGVEVPEDLDALCRDLLRGDPLLRPLGEEVLARLGGPAAPARIAPASAPPTLREAVFIGRERELASLGDAFAVSRSGSSVTVYVHGPSGIGKTTLVRHFVDELRQRHKAVVLAGRCFERESVPYKALDGVVDSLSRYLLSLPVSATAAFMPRDVLTLARLFPVLMQVPSVMNAPRHEQAVPDPQELRHRAFDALGELLRRISDRRPLVIHIDDFQWADTDSLVFLEEMRRSSDPVPLLGIASFRSEEIEARPFLKALLARTRSESRRVVAIDPFTPAEARDLILALLPPDSAPDADLLDTVVRETEGSPFLVEQLTQHALHTQGTSAAGVSLAEMMEARLRLLPPGARALLETLAVVGRPVDVQLLHQAAGLEGDERPLIAAVRAAHLVRASVSAHRIELYHDRVRETLTGFLEPEAIRRIHRRVAATFEAAGMDDPEVLFEHYFGAGDLERAAGHAAAAAGRASQALAFDRAVLLYRRALELGAPGHPKRMELESALAEALANAGLSAQAAQVYLEAADHPAATNALELQRRAAEQLLISGHVDLGLTVIGKVLAAVGMRLPPTPRRALLSTVMGRARLALRGLRFRRTEARDVPPELLLRTDICWSMAAGLALVDIVRAADFQIRHLLLALEAGEPYRIARALAVEAGFSATVGGRGRKRSGVFSRQAEALAREVAHPHALGLATLTRGIAAFCLGEWRRGAELCDEAEKTLREQCRGVAWELTSAQTFLLDCLIYQGEIREVRRRLPGLFATMRERGNLYGTTQLDTRSYLARLAADDPAGAERQIQQAIGRWSHRAFHLQHYNSGAALAQIALYRGDGRAAWERLAAQSSDVRRSLLLRVQMLRVEVTNLEARSALTLAAATDRDPRHWLKVAEGRARRIERESMPWADPLALVVRAAVASRRGDEAATVDLLTQSVAGFALSDMGLHAAVARLRLGAILGGGEGRALIAEAEDWMREQDIRRPDLMSRMLAPGFAESSGP